MAVGGVFALIVVLALTRFGSRTDSHALVHGAVLLLASVPVKLLCVLLLHITVTGRLPAGRWRGIPFVMVVAALAAPAAALAVAYAGPDAADSLHDILSPTAILGFLALPAVHLDALLRRARAR